MNDIRSIKDIRATSIMMTMMIMIMIIMMMMMSFGNR